MDRTPDDVTRAELRSLTASGDLLDLARQMRQMGVESLLVARSDGRIRRMVTDRQIAHLATTPSGGEQIPEQERRRALQSSDPLRSADSPPVVLGETSVEGSTGRPGLDQTSPAATR